MDRRRTYPRGVPYSINYPEIPLYAFLENSARKYPNRDAIIFYGNRMTYGRVWDEAKRLAAALCGLGVEKGDRIGLLLPNVPQFIIAYNAVLAAGGVVVPVNPLNPTVEVGRELAETEADTLIVLDRLLEKLPEEPPRNLIVAEAARYTPAHIRILARLRHRGIKHPPGAPSFEELMKGRPLDPLPEISPKEDLACTAVLPLAQGLGLQRQAAARRLARHRLRRPLLPQLRDDRSDERGGPVRLHPRARARAQAGGHHGCDPEI